MNENNNLPSSGFERCYGCMGSLENGQSICPSCGYNNLSEHTSTRCLKPGTELPGGYVVGKALSKGAFGITYLAYDKTNNRKAVIKEYMPNNLSARSENGSDVEFFDEQSRAEFEKGAEKLMGDAEKVASLNSSSPVITDVYGSFRANGTAYVANEYVEGQTLSSYIAQNGGRLSPDDATRIINPVINALELMHKKNIIHRDVAPDSIIVSPNGAVKLLDFGSARMAYDDSEKNLTQLVKPGYSAREMYGNSKQGPWTDVYAVCATLYTALTGEVPAESMAGGGQALASFESLGIQGCGRLEAVIKEGLEPNAEKRIFSTMQLKEMVNDAVKADKNSPPGAVAASGTTPSGAAFRSSSSAPGANQAAGPAYGQSPTPPPPVQEKKKGKAGKIIAIILVILFVLFLLLGGGIVAALWYFGIIPFGDDPTPSDETTTAVTTTLPEDTTDSTAAGGVMISPQTDPIESTTSPVVPQSNQVHVPEDDPLSTTKKPTEGFTFPVYETPTTYYYEDDDYDYDYTTSGGYSSYDDTLYTGENTFDFSSEYREYYFTPTLSGWYTFESYEYDGEDYLAGLYDSSGNLVHVNDDFESGTFDFWVTGYCYAGETVTLAVMPFEDTGDDINILVSYSNEVDSIALTAYEQFVRYGYYMTPYDDTYADSPDYSSDVMTWESSGMHYPDDCRIDGNTLWLCFSACNSERGDHYVWYPIEIDSDFISATKTFCKYAYVNDGYYFLNTTSLYMYHPDTSSSAAVWNNSDYYNPCTYIIIDDVLWLAFEMEYEDEGEILVWYPLYYY